jgi:GT2 family glycosyltransferase
MNPILTLTHNALEMTKKAVDSFLRQDIDVQIFAFDNGSTDGTVGWLETVGILLDHAVLNAGVSKGWNVGLKRLFNDSDHVLVCNNDVELPPWFYRELLSYREPFITGVSCDGANLKTPPPASNLVPHPDFSAFLIRREAWQQIGPFDEGMRHYAQDCDYHVRATQEGIPLPAANCPFHHERSSTLRLASPEDRDEIEAQANLDRSYFLKKWGFPVGSEEYQRATLCKAGSEIPFPGEIRERL